MIGSQPAGIRGRRGTRRRVAARACVLCMVALLLAAAPAWATKYAAEFMRIGAGARALAVGGAVTALVDDASSVYWNPAGMALVPRAEILLMHSEQFENLADYDFAAYVQSLEGSGTPGVIGIGLVRFAVEDILITRDAFVDADGDHQYDPGEEIDASAFYMDSDAEYAVLLSYARTLRPGLGLGGSLKLIRQDLLDHGSFGMGLDLGALWSPSGALSLGARLSDATTTQLFWDTGTRETVNPSLFLGAALRHAIPSLSLEMSAGADLALTFEGRETASAFGSGFLGGDPRLGFEGWFRRLFAARVGWQESGVTAGAGLRVLGFGVDYAFVPHEDLGSSHRVSAGYTF